MNLKSLGKNQTVVTSTFGFAEQRVFFSYSTPVAAFLADGAEFVQTSENYSATTTRHINAWLRSHGQNPANVRKVPASFLAGLV